MNWVANCLLLIAALFAYGVGILSAQVKPVDKEQSKLEQFSSKSGTLVEKKFIGVGQLKTVKVEVLVLTDLISKIKVAGVRFSKETATRYTSDTKTAFLDADEIDALVFSIEIMKTKIIPSSPDSYTEVVFTSRSGFSAGCYFDSGKWTVFMKLERFDKDSYQYLQSEDIDSFASLLLQAKTKL